MSKPENPAGAIGRIQELRGGIHEQSRRIIQTHP